MSLNELFRLDEHTTRPTAWIIDSSFIWLDHLDKELNDGLRCVEFSASLSLCTRKLAKKIFIDPTKDIFRAAFLITQANSSNKVNKFTQPLFIKRWTSVVLREHSFEWWIIFLNGNHCIVNELSDVWLLGICL